MAPLPVPWDPREPLVLAGVSTKLPESTCIRTARWPRRRWTLPALPAWHGPRAAALSRPWFSVLLQPLSQPESPAPGPPGHMDLEPPPQPLFGTPASQPKKEPPGYEEAVSQQPRRQVKRVAGGPRSGWSQSPGSCGSGVGWSQPSGSKRPWSWGVGAGERVGCRSLGAAHRGLTAGSEPGGSVL